MITLTNSCGGVTEQKLWLFSRADDAGRKYSVGYFLDEKNHLTPVKKYAFCFFATKHVTNLNFVIHAPFLLNDSREGILAGDAHNEKMIELLAALAADALIYLRDIGREGERLIDDRILKIIPTDESDFDVAADVISFKPFFTVIREKLRAEKILPTNDDYTTRPNAYWAETTRLTEIFPDKQLGKIVGNPNASWVFTTVSDRNSIHAKYIRSVVNDFINEDKLPREAFTLSTENLSKLSRSIGSKNFTSGSRKQPTELPSRSSNRFSWTTKAKQPPPSTRGMSR